MAVDYDIHTSECRKEAMDIDYQYWSNEEIDDRIVLRTAQFHKDVGITSAYSAGTDNYKAAKLAIIKAVAADMMSSVETYSQAAKDKMEQYKAATESLKTSDTKLVSRGHNLADELEESNYIAVQSEVVPDIGVDNGLLN